MGRESQVERQEYSKRKLLGLLKVSPQEFADVYNGLDGKSKMHFYLPSVWLGKESLVSDEIAWIRAMRLQPWGVEVFGLIPIKIVDQDADAIVAQVKDVEAGAGFMPNDTVMRITPSDSPAKYLIEEVKPIDEDQQTAGVDYNHGA